MRGEIQKYNPDFVFPPLNSWRCQHTCLSKGSLQGKVGVSTKSGNNFLVKLTNNRRGKSIGRLINLLIVLPFSGEIYPFLTDKSLISQQINLATIQQFLVCNIDIRW